jgi:uncharacterized membrane protein
MDGQNNGWSPVNAPVQQASGGGYPPPPSGGYPPPPGGGYPPPGGGYPPPGYPPQGQPPQYGGPPAPPPGEGLPPNTAAAVAYITFIPALIFILIDPYKRINYVRFHSWQCLVLTGVSIVVAIAFMILSMLLTMIHLGILSLLLGLVHFAISIGFFIFWLIAIIKASKGERYHIPIIGGIAEKMAGNM